MPGASGNAPIKMLHDRLLVEVARHMRQELITLAEIHTPDENDLAIAAIEGAQAAGAREIPIAGESIRLGQLLKFASVVEDGADARAVIEAGEVEVNGEVDTRRGREELLVCDRANALLKQRWKALRHVTLSPSRVGVIVTAALVLITLERGAR